MGKYDIIKKVVIGKLVDKTEDRPFEELSEEVFGEGNCFNSSEVRKRFYGIKTVIEAIDEDNENVAINNSDETIEKILDELQLKKIELEKERKKQQTINVHYNKMLREQARDELWWENVEKVITEMKPFEVPALIKIEHTKKESLLTISDMHYGRSCLIKGLDGEVISEYSNEIFKERMWDLLNQTVDKINEKELTHLNIFNLSDCIDGILRISQLRSLQTGVIDSVLEFSEFMATWLNKLSEYVNIDYFQCWGNHDELRLLTGKKGDFANENVNKLIMKFIELRVETNKNITIHNDDLPFIYTNISGVNIFGYHGEDKNLVDSIRWFRGIYKKPIDIIYGGHLHSQSLQTEGIGSYGDAQCIRVSSICGIDDFSMVLHKSARAGASMFVFEEGKGKTGQEDFWLN